MVKTEIIETTEKYDKDGKLVEKITREETTEDDTIYIPGAINAEDLSGVLPFGDVHSCDCGSGEHCKCGCKEDKNSCLEFKDDGSICITAENVFINQDC